MTRHPKLGAVQRLAVLAVAGSMPGTANLLSLAAMTADAVGYGNCGLTMQMKGIDGSKRPWPQAPLSWKGGLAVFFGTILIEFVFGSFEKRALALPAIVSIIILASAGSMKWQLRRHVWFWITMTIFAAIHATLLLSVHWTTDWVPAVVIIPIGIGDLYVMLTIIDVVGKLVQGRNPLKYGRAHSRLR